MAKVKLYSLTDKKGKKVGMAKAYSIEQAKVITFVAKCGKQSPAVKKKQWKDVYSKLKVKLIMWSD